VIAALNTDVGYAGTWIAAFITLGLALFVVWMLGLLVARPAEAPARAKAPASSAIPAPHVAAGT
jgi:hypothetical protein